MSKERNSFVRFSRTLSRLDANLAKCIHIQSLRFPNYKNLAPNARLVFDYPITVLLGRNGTNKSSVLHALYGSPRGQTIADYWFETKLDAIPERINGLKQSVTHSYFNTDGVEVECIKARAPRNKADPDYWEAVKPTQKYGFPPGATRVPPVDLDVTHLDFRGVLPAFDKYFYFPDERHLAARRRAARQRGTLRREYRKQDYLRHRSSHLQRLLEGEGLVIPPEELEYLRYILERDYKGGLILKHSIYHGHEGWTLKFHTPSVAGGYSDAFAGSGESAAALLVHSILNAPRRSLVLLDEPETSLHPRAQQRMLEFLVDQAGRKELQIVIATHSVLFADRLPPSAIRVLELDSVSRVSISSSQSAREALHEIGTHSYSKMILVEDVVAKHIVLSVLESRHPNAAKDIEVRVRDGGTARIFRDVLAYANSGQTNVFFVLDGDHRPALDPPSPGALPQGEKELDRLISDLTKGPNKAGPALKCVDASERTRFIGYYRTNVHFLPGSTPESLIWTDQRAAEIAEGSECPVDILQETDSKKRVNMLAERIPGLNRTGVTQLLVRKFLAEESDELRTLNDVIDRIRQFEGA